MLAATNNYYSVTVFFMSEHKRKKGVQVEEKKTVSINPDAFTDGRDIHDVLSAGKKERSVRSSIYENLLYTIYKNDFEELERFLEANRTIPTLVVSGEPDLRVFFNGVKGKRSESEELFKYIHSNDGEYKPYIFGSQQFKQTKNTVHYLFGKKSEYPQMWSLRKESEDVSIIRYGCSIPDMPLLQCYLKIEGEVKKGRVKNVTTSMVNLGKDTELGLSVGDNRYISEGFGKPWHTIRDYAKFLDTGGKI